MSRAERIATCTGLSLGALVGSLLGLLGPVAACVLVAIVGGCVGYVLGGRPRT